MILCREEHAKAIDKAVFPMMQGGPLEHCIAAQGRRAEGGDDARVRGLRRTGSCARARALAQGLAEEGLRIVSGGTDSHLALVDLRPLGVSGKDAERVPATRSAITLNKNAIPFDPLPPLDAVRDPRGNARARRRSAWTSREMKEVASVIGDVLRHPEDRAREGRGRERVAGADAAVPRLP